MSNRELTQNALMHNEQSLVPYNIPLSPIAMEKVRAYYGIVDIEQDLCLPIRMNVPNSIKPLYADPSEYGESAKDEFGVIWTTSHIDRGTPIIPCLQEPSLANYRFPDPSSAYRFEHIKDWCQNNKDGYQIIWVGDLWERATFMRGMEDILVDLVINPSFVHDLLHELTQYILQTMEILFDICSFDAIAISDDYGTQRSMVMSPSHWREFVKPLLAEIYAFARKNGRKIFHHSCGNIYPIIPDMIDIGMDILHPIQPEAMDIYQLKREFGKNITLCGGLRTQDLLPNGSPDEVKAEVRQLKREMSKGGGYILEPGITIQADVPIENIVAIIDEARESL